LVANTEGDMNEALKYAKRAVELQPGSGGILDTLAHVYFAKGDFENAVKTQEKAAELEPHSELIKKKLAVFKKAIEDKKK
jgi:cytochrome c-type biogenesis protein CcmH/NrfG